MSGDAGRRDRAGVDNSGSTDANVCGQCGGEPYRPAGTKWLCALCFDRIFGDARARYVAETGGIGFMRHVGMVRPDHGPGFADCACTQCDATAVAVPGDDCPWCLRWLERAQAHDLTARRARERARRAIA